MDAHEIHGRRGGISSVLQVVLINVHVPSAYRVLLYRVGISQLPS